MSQEALEHEDDLAPVEVEGESPTAGASSSSSSSKKNKKRKKKAAAAAATAKAAAGADNGQASGEKSSSGNGSASGVGASAGVDTVDGSVAESHGVPSSAGAESTAPQEEGRSGAQAPVDVQKAMMRFMLGDRELPRSAPRTEREAMERDYKFWKTQPVPGLSERSEGVNEPLEPDKPMSELRADPISLPSEFTWSVIDARDDAQLHDLYVLLRDNYVEDDDMTFRFDYSPEFLRWVLLPPGYNLDWLVGVRVKGNGKLVGFISGIPIHVRIYDRLLSVAEVNFLCVHKKLRSKRLAPVLIREVTRRINLTGIFQAVYTAGVVLPKPIAKGRYFHRPIQHKKLLECGFTVLAPNVTMQRFLKLYKLPQEAPIKGIRRAEEKDLSHLKDLLDQYLKRFSLVPVFVSVDEVRHYLLPRDGVVSTYVIEDLETKVITDFFSFYHLPSSIVRANSHGHKRLYAAYSYYNVCTTHTLQDVLQSALIIAKEDGIDVFNALDIMDNATVLRHLKFGAGDGYLRYYMYNWRCSDMTSSQVGLVLQ